MVNCQLQTVSNPALIILISASSSSRLAWVAEQRGHSSKVMIKLNATQGHGQLSRESKSNAYSHLDQDVLARSGLRNKSPREQGSGVGSRSLLCTRHLGAFGAEDSVAS